MPRMDGVVKDANQSLADVFDEFMLSEFQNDDSLPEDLQSMVGKLYRVDFQAVVSWMWRCECDTSDVLI